MADQPSSGRRRSTSGSGDPATTGTTGAAGVRRGRKGPKKPLSRKQWAWRITRWVLATGLVIVLVLVGFLVYLYKTTDIPSPNAAFQKQTTFVYYADGKHEVGKFVADNQNRVSLKYADMPQNIKDAVVAAEDRSFWSNNGIDPKGILRAAFSNARGNATQGASTITQQYVKILYLNQERSYKRKLKEAILSLKIKRQMSKQQILEGYLNTIYFGRGAYGIEAAAQAYFGEPAKQLTLRQAAVLASVLNDPYGLDPANGKDAKEALQERYDYVLSGMAKAGDIKADQATKAEKHLPKFPKVRAEDSFGGQRGHALTMVKNELLKLDFSPEQIEGGGLRVTTTLTRGAMDAAEQGVKEAEPKGFSDKQLHVGVASVDPASGALRGFYGGQDYLKSQINWASAGGSVGSTMKPVTLATALQAGFSLKDTFDGNSPYVYPNGETVHNEGERAGEANGHSYGAHVNAIYAMEESINTAFIDMTEGIPGGPKKIYENALKMGIPPSKADKAYPGIPSTSGDLAPDDARITLGRATVSPINIANTYATIANGGVRNNVHIVDKVTDRDGKVLYKYKPSDNSNRVMSEDIADDVSYALQQTVQHGTGQSALALNRPAAGKTGTATNDNGDVISAWFTGYTPQMVTSVMYVRGNGRGALSGWLPSYFGADYPARTWTAVMARELEGTDPESFPPPAYVDGEAPTDGHAPVVTTAPPAPPPVKKTHKPEKKPSHKPSPTKSPTPTRTPPPSAPPSTPPPSSPTVPASPTFPGEPQPSSPGGKGGKPPKSP